ncbi:MAG: bacterial/archaeal transporter family protein [Patescibacteria group bacterium]|nr:bacterial/archaeal transporter family protein [Patescibacteria group bacterium]
MNPLFFALVGAFFASIGTIFAKYGLKGIDSNLLTSIRGIVMAIIVTGAALLIGKLDWQAMHSLSGKQWTYIILSGAGGALSWLFFYYALSNGPVLGVTVIDKLSIVITALLAILLLGEKLTLSSSFGLFLVAIGSVLVAVPFDKIISIFK